MIKDSEHKLIVDKLDILQKSLDRLIEDYRDDRRARGDIEIGLKDVASKVSMTREDLADHHKETERAVADGIEVALKPVEKKVNKLVTSKSSVIHFIQDERKKPRFRFWKRGES
jgi:hypothetical protein